MLNYDGYSYTQRKQLREAEAREMHRRLAQARYDAATGQARWKRDFQRFCEEIRGILAAGLMYDSMVERIIETIILWDVAHGERDGKTKKESGR